jgi:hypothetical protein
MKEEEETEKKDGEEYKDEEDVLVLHSQVGRFRAPPMILSEHLSGPEQKAVLPSVIKIHDLATTITNTY